MLRTTGLFVVTALAEILGCALFALALRTPRSLAWLVPAGLCLGLFAWLLTLHPAAAGRVYAAYGAVYVSMALLWLRLVDGMPLTPRDLLGAVVLLMGMAILMGGRA